MVKRISIFDFLRLKHLTQVGYFSPSVDSEASVDYYNDLKLYFRVLNLIVESNELSKSALKSKSVVFASRYSYFLLAKPTKLRLHGKIEKK
jgi:hypothetical protein